jgi:O-antigen/teichoic acid export membrane protein
MPELMRFINEKNQEKCEAAFATVWTILIVFLIPGIIIIQIIMPSLFDIWTRGKVEYNPLLFALLSMTVLIYAMAQPAIAIIQGDNNLKSQFRISLITSIIVVGGMLLFVPEIGILGAGIILVLGELVDTLLYKIAAQRWLFKNGLEWPIKLSRIAAISVLFSALILCCLVCFPIYRLGILIATLIIYSFIILEYYRSLPQIVKHRIVFIKSKFL